MRKMNLFTLLLPTMILGTLSTGNTISVFDEVKRAADSEDHTSENTNLASYLDGAYRLELKVTTSYDDEAYEVDIESDEDNFNLASYADDGSLISLYNYRDGGSTTYLDTLSLGNQVISTDVSVDFDSYFSGPFSAIGSADDIGYFFDVSETEDSLIYTANEYGIGQLTSGFLNSFGTFNSFTWDTTTTSTYIDGLVITTDSDGMPTDIRFNYVTSDRYGGVYETYEGTFTALDEVSDLTSQDSLMEKNSAEYTALSDALSELYAEISQGNFIEYVNMEDSYSNTLSYENYYDFDVDNPGDESTDHTNFMLSNNPLTDVDYGETYTGLRYDYIYLYTDPDDEFPAFYPFGISPDSSTADILYNQYWTEESDILPRVSDLSPDFFTYDSENEIYSFDISSFPYADYDFGIDVLDALLGQGDYLSHVLGTYSADGDFGYFDFTTLTIRLDEEDGPTFTLDYNYQGIASRTTVHFGDFGVTDLRDDDDLAKCLDTFEELY